LVGFEKENPMNLFFWQNCISPHQKPYIDKLVLDDRVDNVYIIVPIVQSLERQKLGWNVDYDEQKVNIIIKPSLEHVDFLFRNNIKDSIHFFSGIRGYKDVYEYFKVSLRYDLKRGLITEGPYTYKKPLLFHKIRFLLLDYKYIKKISFVFAIGEDAYKYYTMWSSNWKVFSFRYTVENSFLKINYEKTSGSLKFVYLGNLTKRKNVELLLKCIKEIFSMEFSLDIIGDGEERLKLFKYINKFKLSPKVSMVGKIKISEVNRVLQTYDVLVIPSFHDGWAAVINEALHNGLFVVASSNCGGKVLLNNPKCGLVFDSNNKAALIRSLICCINNKDLIRAQKEDLQKWANDNISAQATANYFLNCLFSGSITF